jgi:hypothetical protein
MDSYSEGLIQKRQKMQRLLILTQQLRKAADKMDLAKIDNLMNERQVLMGDIDALGRVLSQVDRSDRHSVNCRMTLAKADDLRDEIDTIVNQILIIDEEMLGKFNQSKNAVQQQILTIQQERKTTGQANFLNIKI